MTQKKNRDNYSIILSCTADSQQNFIHRRSHITQWNHHSLPVADPGSSLGSNEPLGPNPLTQKLTSKMPSRQNIILLSSRLHHRSIICGRAPVSGGFGPQPLYRGFAPGSHCGTSILRSPGKTISQVLDLTRTALLSYTVQKCGRQTTPFTIITPG